MPLIDTTITQRAKLKNAFNQAFARTEAIFDLVVPAAYYERPIPLRHPIAFYEGHLPAFIWNTLFSRVLREPSFNPEFDRLFERGIDPENQSAATASAITRWPKRTHIRQYKERVLDRFSRYLNEVNVGKPVHPLLENDYLLYLLLEHELMHQETLLYMLHQLPDEMKVKPASYKPAPDGISVEQRMALIPSGSATLGVSSEVNGHDAFAWDNECPRQQVTVDTFWMDVYNVTNGEYLAFMAAGGYERPEFWTPETWAWKKAYPKIHPPFWIATDEGWYLRDFFETRPLPLSWPVYVTQAEAAAYARFMGKGLPSEAQWHRAAFGERLSLYPWGNEEPQAAHGNFDFHHGSPVPVGSYPQGVSPFGIHDLIGNGWEWTATPFAPFSGFVPSEAYPQYSADFFDGQHFVVKGAACFTDARLLRKSFRNWYYWHYPYMYATFRCVQSAN